MPHAAGAANIGSEHILLALLSINKGRAAQLLQELQVDPLLLAAEVGRAARCSVCSMAALGRLASLGPAHRAPCQAGPLGGRNWAHSHCPIAGARYCKLAMLSTLRFICCAGEDVGSGG